MRASLLSLSSIFLSQFLVCPFFFLLTDFLLAQCENRKRIHAPKRQIASSLPIHTSSSPCSLPLHPWPSLLESAPPNSLPTASLRLSLRGPASHVLISALPLNSWPRPPPSPRLPRCSLPLLSAAPTATQSDTTTAWRASTRRRYSPNPP
jgi:hypothetical protein